MTNFGPSSDHILTYFDIFDLSYSIDIGLTPSYSTLPTDSVLNWWENLGSSKVGL